MLPFLLLALLASPQGSPLAQEAVGETVVTASRTEERELDVPFSVDLIDTTQLKRRSYRTVPQILRDTPGVLVQETSPGQGSPYVRGFTGFRNVFLIDGVRLNNSTFRDGPNQYWNTIDAQSIERVEVLKGPASAMYGSDAIGATVQALTRSPSTYGREMGGRFFTRWASAEQSVLGRIEGDVTHGDRTGVYFGVTSRHFGDLRGGSDIGTQPNTGYDEWAADVKIEHYLDDDTRLSLLHQRVQQNNVPRTHKTSAAKSFEGTSVGSDLRRDLDQDRDLTYVQLERQLDSDFADSMNASLSWHHQSETRDRIRSNLSRSKQGTDVGSLGAFANFVKRTERSRWTYGFDVYRDVVNSFSSSNTIQGPVADDANYDLAGVFLQNEYDINDRWAATVGARATYAAADANSVLDPTTSLQTAISDDWTALTGTARFVYKLDPDKLHLFGGVAQGFRAPNLSDLTRLDSARSNEFEIPSPGLDPEHTVTFELGAKGTWKRAKGQAAVFWTDVQDMIVRVPTGNTNAEGEFEISKENIGDGFVFGLELQGEIELNDSFAVFGNATWMDGEISTYPTSTPDAVDEPIDRLMPPTGQIGLRWEGNDERAWAELVAVVADGADNLSTRDQNDTERIPPGGTPGYVVFHARGGWRTGKRSSFDVAVENIANEDYRVHGSGTNMAGLNVIFGWTYAW